MNNFLRKSYFFIVLIFSGFATAFTRGQGGYIFLFLFTVFVWLYFNIPLQKSYIKVIFIWLLYSAITTILHENFTPFFIFRHVTYITITYVMVNLYRNNLFLKFERVVTWLATISLFFFTWQIIAGDTLLSFARIIDVSGDINRSSLEFRNFIVYTIERSHNGIVSRNYGFAFEPGNFSVFISLAILFNLYRTQFNFKLSSNKKLYILITTLITTFSTTGFLAIGALFIYILFRQNKGYKKYFYLISSTVLFLILIFNIDFLYEKINNLFVAGQEIEEVMERAATTGELYSGGRFGGFIIGWNDFKHYPFFGRAGFSALTSGKVGEGQVYIVNGLANIMSIYGLFGIIIFLTALYKSSLNISNVYKNETKLGFFIILLISLFSFSVYSQYIVFTLIFHSLFSKQSKTLIR